MNTKKQTFQLRKPLLKKILITVGLAALVIFFVLQLLFDSVAFRLINQGDDTVITQLIINAVEALSKPVVQDPRDGKVYLPDARLVLPPYPDSYLQLRYSYTPGDASGHYPTEIQVINQTSMRLAENKLWVAQDSNAYWLGHDPTPVFNQVPNLQVCARGLHLFFVPNTDQSYRLQAQKALQDGRQLYIYSEQKDCNTDTDRATVLDYIKQIQSY